MRLDPEMSDALLAVLDACGIGAFLGDGRRLLDANSSMCRLFERERDELLATEPAAMLGASDRTLMTEYLDSWGGDVSARAVSVVRPAGEPLPAIIASAAAREELRVGVVVDLSELSEAKFDLELFRSLADHSPDGVLLWDGRGVVRGVDLRLRWASRPALNLMLADRTDAVGGRFGDLLPSIPAALADRALALCGTARVEQVGEARLPTPGDSTRLFEQTLIGIPAGLVAVSVVDVTEAREAERRRYALLRRVVEFGDTERRRLAMELHDDAVQQAAASAVLLEGLARRPDVTDRVERLRLAGAAVREVLEALRRLVFDLSPPELFESGLEPAIRSAVDHLFADVPVDVHLAIEGDTGSISREVQTTAFRIAVEALTNARKHARARAVSISIRFDDEHLMLEVRDDGVGLRSGRDVPGHHGLRSMVERAAALGGRCTITSPASSGVHVRASLPLHTAETPALPDELPASFDEMTAAASNAAQRGLEDAAAAFEAARTQAAIAQERLQAAMAASMSLVAPGLDVDHVLELGATQAADAMRCHAVIHICSAGSQTLAFAVAPGAEEGVVAVVDRIAIAPGHARLALDSRSPFLVDVYDDDTSALVEQVLLAPMIAADRRLGVLSLCRAPGSAPFVENDAAFAAWLACQIAVGVALAEA